MRQDKANGLKGRIESEKEDEFPLQLLRCRSSGAGFFITFFAIGQNPSHRGSED